MSSRIDVEQIQIKDDQGQTYRCTWETYPMADVGNRYYCDVLLGDQMAAHFVFYTDLDGRFCYCESAGVCIEELKGRGIASALYKIAAQKLPFVLWSGKVSSDSAKGLWRKLEREGYAELNPDGANIRHTYRWKNEPCKN